MTIWESYGGDDAEFNESRTKHKEYELRVFSDRERRQWFFRVNDGELMGPYTNEGAARIAAKEEVL